MKRLFKIIDDFLNNTTMYRLVLECLIFLLTAAVFLCFFRLLPFTPIDLIVSAIFITAVCFFTNFIFAYVFEAPSNIESVYITALILALIINPANPLAKLTFLAWVSILAMASKYIIALNKKHIFNPAALAVALTAGLINQSASWWVGSLSMAPFVILTGFLIVKKIKKLDLVVAFFLAALLTIVLSGSGQNFLATLEKVLLYSPLMFFAFVMLTEPMTTPPNRGWRIGYGLVTGFLFAPAVHLGAIYSTPELALLAGNVFSYFSSPKKKLILPLLKKTELATGIFNFSFSGQSLEYKPGQYMEWTFEHPEQDNRGIRRYFTLASAPTEPEIKLGVKFYPDSSSYKKAILAMALGDKIVAGQLAGDFVLPKDKNKKLVFIAGGIGITPFRSMIKYLLDIKEKRPIILFYSNRSAAEIVYKDIFDRAERELAARIFYVLTDEKFTPPDWPVIKGRLSEEIIIRQVPDYRERLFYLSGPPAMVDAFKNVLRKMGVKARQIKTDYFPGLA